MIRFIIFFTIITIILVFFCIKLFKKSNSLIERALYLLFLVLYFLPIIIYLLDNYNIPSKFGYINNIDTSRWFAFFSSYFISIISTIISGVILVYVTHKQIINDNLRKDEELKEQRRVNNIPILKCSFKASNRLIHNHLIIMSSSEKYSQGFCILSFDLENIGLNTARNITCGIKNKDTEFETFSIPNDGNYILKVGSVESYGLMIEFDLRKEKNKNLVVTFYYDDLFNNHYAQDIEMKVKIASSASKFKCQKGIEYEVISWKDIIVKNERLLKE